MGAMGRPGTKRAVTRLVLRLGVDQSREYADENHAQRCFGAIITAVVLIFGIHTMEAGQDSPPLSPAQVIQILSSPDRTTADRTNDLRRKPEQMLGFIGIRPGIVALDLSAAGGYTTELLARSIGPTGKVYGQSRPHDPSQAPTSPAVSEGNSHPNLASAATPAASPAAPRAITGRTGRSRREAPRSRYSGRADRRPLPALRGSGSLGFGVGAY
jgi:hypothetical protein